MAEDQCPFCRRLMALDRATPDDVVWQFPRSVAFLGQWQYYHGYCVLVSRRHATELHQLPDEERTVFLDEMCKLAQGICDAFHPHKLNYELLGNQVPHLHWHLFPRYTNDPERLNPVWLTLERAKRSQAEKSQLEAGPVDRVSTIARLREALATLF